MRRNALIIVIVGIVAASLLLWRQSIAAQGTAIRGEVVETYCWGALQIGGAGHAKCGIECIRRGIPAAIYDAQSRKAFVLLPGRDKASLPPELIAAMGRKVIVRGDIINRGGTAFVTVRSWELQR